MFLVSVMVLCLVPTSAFAVGTQNAAAGTTVDGTKVAFAGHEWWVIGDSTSGVYQQPNHITLLAAHADFGDTHFGSNSDYAGSALQEKMLDLASNISIREQRLISSRDLTADISPTDVYDGIKGQNANKQKLWALSRAELETLGESSKNSFNKGWNNSWWLRTPKVDQYDGSTYEDGIAVIYYYDKNGGLCIGARVGMPYFVRPALSLNLSSALFLSDIKLKSDTITGAGLVTPASSTGTIKFTMTDETQALTLRALWTSASASEALTFQYSGAKTGDGRYVSCILTDTDGNLKYYGKLASCYNASSGKITVPLCNVADGTYTLQIFSEQSENGNYTDFCSVPVTMTVTASEGRGTASSFNGDIMFVPQLKIDENTDEWCVSYDNGQSWTSLGVKATGKTGAAGADGKTPYIGANGNWWIGETDTGMQAQGNKGDTGAQGEKGDKGDTGAAGRDGKDGADGKDDINGKNSANCIDGKDGVGVEKAEINAAGELVITYTDGTASNLGVVVGADGKDGLTPFVGDNGNWWIGEKDTGVIAAASASTPAKSLVMLLIGGTAGLALLCNVGLIVYILRKKKTLWERLGINPNSKL